MSITDTDKPLIAVGGVGRHLGEIGVVALAASAWLGASAARPLPLGLGLGVVLVAVALRRPVLLIVGVGLLASSLGAAAWSGLEPASESPYDGSVLLVSDPSDTSGAVGADVKLDDGRRVELWARGGAAGPLRDALAGERIGVHGDVQPPPADAPWLSVRHVIGRLAVDSVSGAPQPNDALAAVANDYRRILVTGSFALPAEQRPLFLGFVLGDDRGQDPAVVDDFRGSGLSHLLVVSGQNVAFLLVVAGPVLGRLPMPARLAATVALLAWFTMLTRFEPSVLRATAMAGVSALAVFRGIRVSPVRVLSLAVTGLLLIDPFLQASTGFRLSVGASAGIVLLAAPLGAVLPGPRMVREALGVTLAAQVGVAPVLINEFGGIPTASIVANLLAVPAAGPVMMWGLTGGAAAGLFGPVAGGALSRLVHLPTRLLLWWVAWVARVGATLPLGLLEWGSMAAAVFVVALLVWARRTGRRRPAQVAAVLIAVVLLTPAIALRPTGTGSVEVADGATLWQSDGVAVLVLAQTTAKPVDVLEGVRRRGVGRVDLFVSASGAHGAVALLEAVRSRLDVRQVWQPVNGFLTSARTPAVAELARFGELSVRVRANEPRLVVDVTA